MNLFKNLTSNKKDLQNYLMLLLSFNFFKSVFITWVNLDTFLSCFFIFTISKTSIKPKDNNRSIIKGSASIQTQLVLLFFSLLCNCQPRKTGKKNRMMHPKPRRPTAHSRFSISHGNVNQSISFFYKNQVTSVTYKMRSNVQAIIEII